MLAEECNHDEEETAGRIFGRGAAYLCEAASAKASVPCPYLK
jgi:hypothetical protein